MRTRGRRRGPRRSPAWPSRRLRAAAGRQVVVDSLHHFLARFDHIRRGDDWLAYVGKPCEAYGILHTYTRDIDGYRNPRLEVKEFSGTRE